MPEGRLIVICGLPGSGKTTLARTLESELSGVRMCPDEWMQALDADLYDEVFRGKVEALQWELGRRLLALGRTVIIEWGTWGRSERDTLRVGARELGAAVELRYLTAPLDVLFERIRARGLEDPPLSMADLQQAAGLIQVPTAEELALFDPPSGT